VRKHIDRFTYLVHDGVDGIYELEEAAPRHGVRQLGEEG